MSIPARSRGSSVARARDSYAARHLLVPVQKFIHTESSSGFVLLAAAALALLWVNSPWNSSYHALWNAEVSLRFGPFLLAHSLREWVNDALMVLFFFVVGLEVKREFVHGELSDWRKASLPIAAALGGMVVPAALYAVMNAGTSTSRGCGIPMATDIAFAVGVLALLGDRIPATLRILLLALATVDDIGAILVIAFFYTDQISPIPVLASLLLIFMMVGMWKIGLRKIGYFLPIAVLFWFAVLQSGIHATIAGVVLGLMTPTVAALGQKKYARTATLLLKELAEAEQQGSRERADAILGEVEELTASTETPADRLLRLLHPWSSYVALPIFALANAGVVLTPTAVRAAFVAPETQGILVGLGFGKVAGIVLLSYLAVRLRLVVLPQGVRWAHMAGIGLLGGIGFTVSLFISDLAFANPDNIANAKTGILVVSLLAGLLGFLVLRVSSRSQSSIPG